MQNSIGIDVNPVGHFSEYLQAYIKFSCSTSVIRQHFWTRLTISSKLFIHLIREVNDRHWHQVSCCLVRLFFLLLRLYPYNHFMGSNFFPQRGRQNYSKRILDNLIRLADKILKHCLQNLVENMNNHPPRATNLRVSSYLHWLILFAVSQITNTYLL